jgi:large subunit ribosomal protein L18e
VKNKQLIDTIKELEKASDESSKAIWSAIAKNLDKPKRSRITVNLSQIDRHTQEGDVVAVPGKVLAAGSLSKTIRIAACSFSEGAIEKIKSTKSEAMTLNELLNSDIQPKQIKIIK